MSRTLSASAGVHDIARPARTRRLQAVLKTWWAAYLRRRMERQIIAQLRGMSDRELKDIGLVRSEIEIAVMHGMVPDDRGRRAREAGP